MYESGGWMLELSQTACMQGIANEETGVFVGNGKIGMHVDFVGGGLQKAVIAGDFKTQRGVYRSNAIETFRTCSWQPFSAEADHVQATPLSQRLNMKTGVVTSDTKYLDLRQSPSPEVTISSDIYAPRQVPYCTVQTMRVSGGQDTLLFNTVDCTNAISDAEFAYNVIDVDMVSTYSSPLSMLAGRGQTDNVTIAFASCVVFEDAASGHALLGFNCFKDDPRKAYVKVLLKSQAAAVRMHCITVHMTSFDFEDPYNECKTILLSILNRPALLSLNAIQRMREDHVSAWSNVWKADIVFKSRASVSTAEQKGALDKTQRYMRQCLYLIYSCTREGVNIDINPSTFGMIDSGNTTIYDGDLFLIPLLLFVMPGAAKSLLEYRYKQLSNAVQLAASYGFSGAKFPYSNDVMGYRNALYWDSASPMYVFNNALIALNTWNYYRVSMDREWLMNRGYPILRGCADFFVSRCTVDSFGVYHLKDVMTFNKRFTQSDDNSFTNNLVKLATKATIEASYELGYQAKKEWRDMMNRIPINVGKTGLETYEVVLFDAACTPDNAADDSYDVAEAWFVMTPMMSENYFLPGSNRGFESAKRNFEFYSKRIPHAFKNHPLNVALSIGVCGVLNKYNTTYVDDFDELLTTKIDEDINASVWGMDTCTTTAAMLPLMVLNAVGGINVAGGVSETRFYYEEMTIKGLYANNMPRHWDSLVVANVGPMKKTFVVHNQHL